MREQRYYNKVFYASINNYLFPKNTMARVKKIYAFIKPIQILNSSVNNKIDWDYDEVYYNNDDLFLYNIIFTCVKKNGFVKIFRFEEGYSSYLSPFCSIRGQKICDFRNKFRGVEPFEKYFSGSYFYEPTMVTYTSNAPYIRLSRNISEYTKKIIAGFFEVSNRYQNIMEHWIVFEESFSQDIEYNEDLLLYKQVNELLKGDMVVKLHPRSKKDRFTPLGIKTLPNDGIPWEAVLLSGKINDKKFISLASGSILNAKLLLGDKGESWLLYKCINKSIPILNTEFEEFITTLMKKEVVKNLNIPDSYEDFKKSVEQNEGYER